MKGLHNFLQKNVKPKFEPKEGKKKGLMFWVYDSLETFLFTPGHATKKGSHIRDGIDLKRTMFMVIVALIPCLLFGIYNTGHQYYLGQGLYPEVMDGFWDKIGFGLIKVLPFVIVAYGVGLGVEFIFCWAKGHEIHEGFLVSGMLIPLVMPMDTPLWMVAVATAFAVLIGKEVFGGTGMNILNVALLARAFIFFAHPTAISGNVVWIHADEENGVKQVASVKDGELGVENLIKEGKVYNINDEVVGEYIDYELTADSKVHAYSGETALGIAASTATFQKKINANQNEIDGNNEVIKELESKGSLTAVEESNLKKIKADNAKREQKIEDLTLAQEVQVKKLPSISEAMIGFIPGCIGETSAIACLIGALFLIFVGIGSWEIMASMFAGGFLMAVALNATGMNPFTDIDPMHQLMLGGFMFGMAFMATDPVTAAQTRTGKFIYGAIAGSLGILIRVVNPAYPEGIMLAILFANVCAPLIDHMVVSSNIKRRQKRLKAA